MPLNKLFGYSSFRKVFALQAYKTYSSLPLETRWNQARNQARELRNPGEINTFVTSPSSGTRWSQARNQAREWRNLQEINILVKPQSSGTRWNQARNQARESRNLQEIINFGIFLEHTNGRKLLICPTVQWGR